MNNSLQHVSSSSQNRDVRATSPTMMAAWNVETGADPVDTSAIDKKRRKGSFTKKAGKSQNGAFYEAAQPSQANLMFFDVKYYGVCPNIPVDSASPVMVNVSRLLTEKADEAKRTGVKPYAKGQIYFSEKGLAVLEKSNSIPVVSWFTHNLASMASVRHPCRYNRRIALMKVRAPSGVLQWHLFKYAAGKNDNMSECFRYIVDCSLREIGRAVASGNTASIQQTYGGRGSGSSAPPQPPKNAWDQPPPPQYTPAATQRELDLEHLYSEARAEAQDILAGQQRMQRFGEQ